METVAHVNDVIVVDTRSGKKRYEIADSRERKYTTFRTAIGERAAEFRLKPFKDLVSDDTTRYAAANRLKRGAGVVRAA